MNAAQTAYLRSLRALMQEAVKQTQRFDAKWNRLNGELNQYLEDSNVDDVVQQDKIKSVNIALRDALGAGNWWRDKATYLANVIQAELAMMEAEL
jgi:hypothetical protein